MTATITDTPCIHHVLVSLQYATYQLKSGTRFNVFTTPLSGDSQSTNIEFFSDLTSEE